MPLPHRHSLPPQAPNPFLPVPARKPARPMTREEKDRTNLINRRRKKIEASFRKVHQLYTHNECDVYLYLKPRDGQKALIYNTEPYEDFPAPYESIKIRYPRTEINTPTRPKHMLKRALGMNQKDDGPAPGWRGPTFSSTVAGPDQPKPPMFVRDLPGAQTGPSMLAPQQTGPPTPAPPPAGSSSSMFPFLHKFSLSQPTPTAGTERQCQLEPPAPGPEVITTSSSYSPFLSTGSSSPQLELPAPGPEVITTSSSYTPFLSNSSSSPELGSPFSPSPPEREVGHAAPQLEHPIRDDGTAEAGADMDGSLIQPSRKRHVPVSFYIPIKTKRFREESLAQLENTTPHTPSPGSPRLPATPQAPHPRPVAPRTDAPRTPSPGSPHLPATPPAPNPRRVAPRMDAALAPPTRCLVRSHTGTRLQLRNAAGRFTRQA